MTRRDGLALLLLGAIWGASFLFLRVAAPAFGPVPLIAFRVTLAATVLGGVLAWRGGLGALRGRWRPLAVVGLLNSALPFSLFAWATLSIPAGLAAVTNATVPLFAVTLGALGLGEPAGRRAIAGTVVGFTGVVLLVAGDLAGRAHPLAVVAGLCSSASYAVAAHYSRRRLAGLDPLAAAAGSQVMAAAWLVLPALALLPAAAPPPAAWGAAITLGLLCTGVAYVLFFYLLARVGPSRTVLVTYLIPVFGMLWGALALGERVTAPMLLASAVVLAGVAIVQLGGARQR